MEIREAKPSEAEKITRELWLPLAREMEEVSEYNGLKEDLDIQNSVEHKREKLESEEGYIFLAEQDSNLVGYISVKVKDSIPIFSRGKKLKISELFVKKDFRNKGIASQLMENSIELAEEKEVDTLEINVNIENKAAKNLYQKHGFDIERHRMMKNLS